METVKVTIKKYIEQVADGSMYKGTLEIAKAKFDYELTFTIPIAKLENALPHDKDEIPKLVPIVIRRGDTKITLTNDEYGFFFSVLSIFAVNFYYNPQTRASNEGAIGSLLRQEGPLAKLGASFSIGVSNSATYHLPVELCETLNTPKFGCAIATS